MIRDIRVRVFTFNVFIIIIRRNVGKRIVDNRLHIFSILDNNVNSEFNILRHGSGIRWYEWASVARISVAVQNFFTGCLINRKYSLFPSEKTLWYGSVICRAGQKHFAITKIFSATDW